MASKPGAFLFGAAGRARRSVSRLDRSGIGRAFACRILLGNAIPNQLAFNVQPCVARELNKRVELTRNWTKVHDSNAPYRGHANIICNSVRLNDGSFAARMDVDGDDQDRVRSIRSTEIFAGPTVRFFKDKRDCPMLSPAHPDRATDPKYSRSEAGQLLHNAHLQHGDIISKRISSYSGRRRSSLSQNRRVSSSNALTACLKTHQ